MSPSPSKASVKEHKGNKTDKSSPFLGSTGWKKESDSDKSKIFKMDELSKLTKTMELYCFGRKIYQIWFCLLYLYISIKKINIISKFALTTNNVIYVHIVSGFYHYQGCPAI